MALIKARYRLAVEADDSVFFSSASFRTVLALIFSSGRVFHRVAIQDNMDRSVPIDFLPDLSESQRSAACFHFFFFMSIDPFLERLILGE